MVNSNSTFFSPDIFGGRYQIKLQVTSKGGRKTLLAKDIKNDTLVIIKLLIFGIYFSWEDFKLFEREAETLKSLSHSAIPKYLEYFEINTQDIKGFALIQSYIAAPSLVEQMKSGRNFSELEVKQIAKEILKILEYLHSRQPAVIHRDIKPSNILLGDRSGNSVGDIYLVDFGSVQNLAMKKSSTMTVVGTYGYMPPEQFIGRAKPASDLYSLGVTLIYIVTGEHPADLPEKDLEIEFEKFCNLSPGFIHWLKQITNPSLSNRLSSANEALKELANCDNYQDKESKKFIQPPNTKIILRQERDSLEVIIPPKSFFVSENIGQISTLIFFLSPYFIFVLILFTGISLEAILNHFQNGEVTI